MDAYCSECFAYAISFNHHDDPMGIMFIIHDGQSNKFNHSLMKLLAQAQHTGKWQGQD